MDGQVYVKVQAADNSSSKKTRIGISDGSISVQYRIDFNLSTGFTGHGWDIPANQYNDAMSFSQYVVPNDVSATQANLSAAFSTISGASYYAGYIVNTMGCGA